MNDNGQSEYQKDIFINYDNEDEKMLIKLREMSNQNYNFQQVYRLLQDFQIQHIRLNFPFLLNKQEYVYIMLSALMFSILYQLQLNAQLETQRKYLLLCSQIGLNNLKLISKIHHWSFILQVEYMRNLSQKRQLQINYIEEHQIQMNQLSYYYLDHIYLVNHNIIIYFMNQQEQNSPDDLEDLQLYVECQQQFQDGIKMFAERAKIKVQFFIDLFAKLKSYEQQSREKQNQQINPLTNQQHAQQQANQVEQYSLRGIQQTEEIKKQNPQLQEQIQTTIFKTEQEQIKNQNLLISQPFNEQTNHFNQSLNQDSDKRKLRQRQNKNKKEIKYMLKQKQKYKKKLKRSEQCELCNAKFINYYGLVYHEQKYHNIYREVKEQDLIKEEELFNFFIFK
ncbi:hypothetical protein pb186bvf_003665 [Paramecium bursaria]